MEALKRAYESLQLKVPYTLADRDLDFAADAKHGQTDFDDEPSQDYGSQSHSHGLARGMGHDPLDTHVDSHFHVVNAFDIPGMRFDAVRGTFVT